MRFPRTSGILLHITALPSPYGIGDLGPSAYKFIDWLKNAKQSLWQILPFSIADDNGCPYSGYSAYGAYPLLISPDKLIEDGLLSKSDIIDAQDIFGDRVKYSVVQEYKSCLFYKAYENFKATDKMRSEFLAFCQAENEWLHDLAIFCVIAEQFGLNWTEWPKKFKQRQMDALKAFADKNIEQVNYHKFLQFIFFRQWDALKAYANTNGIKIIGDVPIFLSHFSMDIWKNPELFKLDEEGNPTVVTGAPPDEFSDVGQKWGNPNYNWWAMEQDGFNWWIKRMRFILRHYDIVRLDHFRGFAATWEIPTHNPDPRSGWWSEVPGWNIFHCLLETLGDIPVIVEDLGKITDDVIWLRERFGFPGMKVLQLAFNKGESNVYLPHHYPDHCVVYTGTHDNATTKGWFDGMGDTLEKHYAASYCGAWNWDHMNWTLINTAMHSRASIAIVPLQDVMGLGNEARFNTPGIAKGNWAWRFKWEDLHEGDQFHLSQITWDAWRNR